MYIKSICSSRIVFDIRFLITSSCVQISGRIYVSYTLVCSYWVASLDSCWAGSAPLTYSIVPKDCVTCLGGNFLWSVGRSVFPNYQTKWFQSSKETEREFSASIFWAVKTKSNEGQLISICVCGFVHARTIDVHNDFMTWKSKNKIIRGRRGLLVYNSYRPQASIRWGPPNLAKSCNRWHN